jgi:DTW domain-containing protein YfiP
MLVLFDNGTPRTLVRFLIDRHMVTEARARGWQELENGELLKQLIAIPDANEAVVTPCTQCVPVPTTCSA